MASRCPTSKYHSFGVLKGYKWIIGERGYANVIKMPDVKDKVAKEEQHVVQGMLYTLSERDEEALDVAEGVPFAYLKRDLDIELISRDAGENGGEGRRRGGAGEVVKALVYVDERRLGEGVCKEEYVARMNRGIRDAVGKGMEEGWVRRYVRPFVREEDVPDDGKVEDPFHPSNVEAYEEDGY
jgi:gamma-glutamylcyclotransferase